MRIILLPWRRDVACRELVELVTDYLEEALPRRQRVRLRRHLRDCGDCAHYLEQVRTVVRLTGRLRLEDLPAMPAATRADLRRSFRAAYGA
jgi:Putative zinc-finger